MSVIQELTEQQKCNLRLAYKLLDLLLDHPELRFIQALWNLGIIEDTEDRFYEPSNKTLERVKVREKQGSDKT